ncbi:thiamine pyrophosphate-dependent enzyme [Nocardia sp. NBC_01388]|uniref:thiamine pyrophosphate-dependent enzyme n=1 Tax=Nocardia sp. NBC_01388 TaxID=2903596 RepID=UPI0032472B86
MLRIEALRVIADCTAELPVVVTCAASSRELAAVADRPNHLYLLDSMGLAISAATGIALGITDTPVPKVVAIEGDGSLLMNPNVLPTGGFLRPAKLVTVLLDNAVYGATANLPTYADTIDLGLVAEATGWTVHRAADALELRAALVTALDSPGPVLVHTHIEVGNATNVPKLLEDPVIIGRRFQDWLRARIAAPAEALL